LKVGVYIVNVPATDGGGYSYTEKLVRGIDAFEFDSRLEICFVGRFAEGNVRLKKKYIRLSSPSMFRFFNILKKLSVLDFFLRVFSIDLNRSNRGDVQLLRRNQIDTLLYIKQSFKEVDGFPFITMNWDIGYRSTYSFPELAGKDNVAFREQWYGRDIHQALAIFTESESGKKELSKYFGITEKKIEVVPMFPGGVVDLVLTTEQHVLTLKDLGLEKNHYYYYPAQYWAHKNHYNLLVAFRKFQENKSRQGFKLVFTGSDQGNKKYIASVVESLGLGNYVLMLDFVSNETLNVLYKNARALVMPSFLGPTNMPPLEALAMEVPVLCSDLDGHREMCGELAIYFSPDQSDEIADALEKIADQETFERYKMKLRQTSSTSGFNLPNALRQLEKALIKIDPIRKTFE
jgi:glycosyltransferase involved in cell wall biosynthesis